MGRKTDLQDVLDVVDGFCGDTDVSLEESLTRYQELAEHCQSAADALQEDIEAAGREKEDETVYEGEDGG